jgi:predicted enzyme related to lactoylglutathione lyase
MSASKVSAVLFAKDCAGVSEFYAAVLGVRALRQDAGHALFECDGFELVVHRIPAALAAEIEIENPPRRHESGAIRLNFPIRDIALRRLAAARLGGVIDSQPPSWAEPDSRFFLGHDPEGNVFGVSSVDT